MVEVVAEKTTFVDRGHWGLTGGGSGASSFSFKSHPRRRYVFIIVFAAESGPRYDDDDDATDAEDVSRGVGVEKAK